MKALQREQDQKGSPEHLKPTLPSGSIYSEVESLVLLPAQRLRQSLLAPLAIALSRLGISADLLSWASVAFGLGFLLLAPFHFSVAFWLLMASLGCDALDGVEARATKTNTARGGFTDLFCDQTVLALCVAGLAWKGLVQPVLAVIFVYTYTVLAIFLVLHRLLRVSTTGLLRPSRLLLCAAVALYYFFRVDLFNALLLFYLLTFPLVFVSFRRLNQAL